jgi:hypothetical protein
LTFASRVVQPHRSSGARLAKRLGQKKIRLEYRQAPAESYLNNQKSIKDFMSALSFSAFEGGRKAKINISKFNEQGWENEIKKYI